MTIEYFAYLFQTASDREFKSRRRSSASITKRHKEIVNIDDLKTVVSVEEDYKQIVSVDDDASDVVNLDTSSNDTNEEKELNALGRSMQRQLGRYITGGECPLSQESVSPVNFGRERVTF